MVLAASFFLDPQEPRGVSVCSSSALKRPRLAFATEAQDALSGKAPLAGTLGASGKHWQALLFLSRSPSETGVAVQR